jgi:hypothetical protein
VQANFYPACKITSSIASDFNGTAINGDRYVWFNSIVKASGVGSGPVNIFFRNGSITFNVGTTSYTLPVPDAHVQFAGTGASSTAFSSGKWETSVPARYGKNAFLSGLAYKLPANFPGGIKPVAWSGQIAVDDPGVSLQWKWAAAVYTTFDGNAGVDVKPVDDGINSDHAGTPENFKQYVVGGARGGGGSNFTGSYSGTMSVSCTGTAKIIAPEEKEVPTSFALLQNYPNPFNPSTTIQYGLPIDAKVTLIVYDVLGRQVVTLVEGQVSAGMHDVVVDASNLASGMYFYRIVAVDGNGAKFTSVKKMLLMK